MGEREGKGRGGDWVCEGWRVAREVGGWRLEIGGEER